LFVSPEVQGELKVARDELETGHADLPALTVRHVDSSETIVSYDPSKSASEKLAARAILRLSHPDAWLPSISHSRHARYVTESRSVDDATVSESSKIQRESARNHRPAG
jgi:hypothetical protein